MLFRSVADPLATVAVFLFLAALTALGVTAPVPAALTIAFGLGEEVSRGRGEVGRGDTIADTRSPLFPLLMFSAMVPLKN